MRRLSNLDGLRSSKQGRGANPRSPLVEVTGFGSNPGNLRMFSFVPELRPPRALVVVLHGCGQTAAAYDLGAGWSTLARHFGFALLMPEQRRTNSVNTCFNWFNPHDSVRDHGEACSIRQMIEQMVATHGIDARRISVTGLSAGGAMTLVMLATYPEVFTSGAVIAGLPYGVASNLRRALGVMLHPSKHPAHELGDFVRKASDYQGPWPKISVWHGSADRTVNPDNADEIIKQWLDVHDQPEAAMAETTVDGYPRKSWQNADGETIVESYTITNMAHGTPIGVAGDGRHYGMEGAFLIEAGISSSYHIAKFFGLTESAVRSTLKVTAELVAATPPALSPAPHLARSIRKLASDRPTATPTRQATRRLKLRAVIRRALRAAGLKK